jgi:hypothetical protein
MTPAEVDALDDETYNAFSEYMQREAYELERLSKRRA